MKTREDRQLTRHMRPRLHSEHYEIVALTVAVGLYLLMMLARSAFASPPTTPQLQRSLRAAAHPQVSELRRKMAGKGAGVAETHGMYIRAPECVIKDIISTKITHPPGSSVTGLVLVSCVWKSTDQRTFGSREEAEDAELTEEEPGKLRLMFAWAGGHWAYKGAKKEP